MEMTAAIIGPAHGLRGEALLDVRTDDIELIVAGTALRTTSKQQDVLTIASVRHHKQRVLVSFEEVDTREGIEALRGVKLLVEAIEEDDAWYPHQLKGLEAVTITGEKLGTISGLQVGSAQDLLLVKTTNGTVMVPFVTQLVPTVDIEGGKVVLDPPLGLFDDQYIGGADGGQ